MVIRYHSPEEGRNQNLLQGWVFWPLFIIGTAFWLAFLGIMIFGAYDLLDPVKVIQTPFSELTLLALGKACLFVISLIAAILFATKVFDEVPGLHIPFAVGIGLLAVFAALGLGVELLPLVFR